MHKTLAGRPENGAEMKIRGEQQQKRTAYRLRTSMEVHAIRHRW